MAIPSYSTDVQWESRIFWFHGVATRVEHYVLRQYLACRDCTSWPNIYAQGCVVAIELLLQHGPLRPAQQQSPPLLRPTIPSQSKEYAKQVRATRAQISLRPVGRGCARPTTHKTRWRQPIDVFAFQKTSPTAEIAGLGHRLVRVRKMWCEWVGEWVGGGHERLGETRSAQGWQQLLSYPVYTFRSGGVSRATRVSLAWKMLGLKLCRDHGISLYPPRLLTWSIISAHRRFCMSIIAPFRHRSLSRFGVRDRSLPMSFLLSYIDDVHSIRK